jgi:hypothetical protein
MIFAKLDLVGSEVLKSMDGNLPREEVTLEIVLKYGKSLVQNRLVGGKEGQEDRHLLEQINEVIEVSPRALRPSASLPQKNMPS